MKKTFFLFITAFLTVSVFGQNVKNLPDLFNKVVRQKEVSLHAAKDIFLIFKDQNKLPLVKAANLANQHLDSVIIEEWDKNEFLYDASGNVTRNTYFEWSGSQWDNISKEDYTYDENRHLASTVYSDWNGTGWAKNWKFERTYDSKGNPLKNSGYSWTGSVWENYYIAEFKFDSNDRIMAFTSKVKFDGVWTNETKEGYSYNDAGNLTEFSQYRWENNQWVDHIEIKYTFDDSGNQLQWVQYFWDGLGWNEDGKVDYIYNENNKITQSGWYAWSTELNDWLYQGGLKITYDANGNQILFEIFNNELNTWKVESAYDDSGNKIAVTDYIWDEQSLKLVPSTKVEYFYETEFSFEDLILPAISEGFSFELDLFTSKMTRAAYSDWDGAGWTFDYDYTLSYSDNILTGVKNLNMATGVTTYPNPATDQVIFRIDDSSDGFTVNLYNIRGELVLSQVSYNNKTVSVESLNEGMYFYYISKDLNSYTGKFMVK